MERRDLHDLFERLELLTADGTGDAAEAELRAAVAADAELAARLAHIQTFDRAAAERVQDVTVPAGLAERIQARLRAEAPATKVPPKTPARPRRYWTVGVSAAVLLLVAGVFVWRQWPDPAWTNDRVVQEAAAWFLNERGALPRKGTFDGDAPEFGFAASIPAGKVVGSKQVRFLGKAATLYLVRCGDDEALAFVVDGGWFSENLVPSAYARGWEVRFFEKAATGEVCILIGPNLDRFLQKSAVLS